jgi:hypothetical protein
MTENIEMNVTIEENYNKTNLSLEERLVQLEEENKKLKEIILK